MLDFSFAIIQLTKLAPITPENKIITDQIIRSSSSVGANYAEANNAASKLDFRNKIFIAKKEAAETRYWLRLFSKANPDIDINTHLDECNQMIFILQKIVSTMKNGQ